MTELRQRVDEHCVPGLECPICRRLPDIVLPAEDTPLYHIECECGLWFGLPYGYSSRLDLINDWNNRAPAPEAE